MGRGIRINSILIIPRFEVLVGKLGGAIQHEVATGDKVGTGLQDRAQQNLPTLNVLIHEYKEALHREKPMHCHGDISILQP